LGYAIAACCNAAQLAATPRSKRVWAIRVQLVEGALNVPREEALQPEQRRRDQRVYGWDHVVRAVDKPVVPEWTIRHPAAPLAALVNALPAVKIPSLSALTAIAVPVLPNPDKINLAIRRTPVALLVSYTIAPRCITRVVYDRTTLHYSHRIRSHPCCITRVVYDRTTLHYSHRIRSHPCCITRIVYDRTTLPD
jgi:hypothetical protein